MRLTVHKKDGNYEPFNINKAIKSVDNALNSAGAFWQYQYLAHDYKHDFFEKINIFFAENEFLESVKSVDIQFFVQKTIRDLAKYYTKFGFQVLNEYNKRLAEKNMFKKIEVEHE